MPLSSLLVKRAAAYCSQSPLKGLLIDGKADVAAALLEQIEHPDAALRKEALTALARMKEGRKALLDGLLTAASPDAAWLLARTLAASAAELSPDLRRRSASTGAGRFRCVYGCDYPNSRCWAGVKPQPCQTNYLLTVLKLYNGYGRIT